MPSTSQGTYGGYPIVRMTCKHLQDLAVCGRSNLRSCAKAGEGTRQVAFPVTGKAHASHNADVADRLVRNEATTCTHSIKLRAGPKVVFACHSGEREHLVLCFRRRSTRGPLGFVHKIKSDMHDGADSGRRKDDQIVPGRPPLARE